MSKQLKVGVVGCGEIAQIAHLPYLKELPNFSVEAICDVSPAVLAGVGDQFNVAKRTTDYRELVSMPDLDVVLVCNRDHAEPVIAALENGKHVMVEKPMAFNLRQADDMIAAARENKRKLMVAYMKRYDPGYQYALAQIKAIPQVHLIRIHDFGGSYHINNEIYDLFRATDIPQSKIKEARTLEDKAMLEAIGEGNREHLDTFSLLMYNCSHDAIVLREAFGSPERIIDADVYGNGFVLASLEYKLPSGTNTRCVWETGLEMNLSDWDEQIAVYGSDRRVSVHFPFPYLKNAVTEVVVGQMENEVFVEKHVTASFDEAFKREWRHFYDCVVNDQEPITGADKGRADIALLIDLLKTATKSK